MLLDRSGRDEHAAALRASASDGDLSVGSCGVVFSAIGRRVLFVSLIPFRQGSCGASGSACQGPEGRWEILLTPACNLMHYLAHLFTVRSCWCRRASTASWRVGRGGSTGQVTSAEEFVEFASAMSPRLRRTAFLCAVTGIPRRILRRRRWRRCSCLGAGSGGKTRYTLTPTARSSTPIWPIGA